MNFRIFLVQLNKTMGRAKFITTDILRWYQQKRDPYKSADNDLRRLHKMKLLSRERRYAKSGPRYRYWINKKGKEYLDLLLYKDYPTYFVVNIIKLITRGNFKRLTEYLEEMDYIAKSEMFGMQSRFMMVLIEALRTNQEKGMLMGIEHLLSLTYKKNYEIVEKSP